MKRLGIWRDSSALRVFTALTEYQIHFLEPTSGSFQPPINSSPRDLTPSCGLCGHLHVHDTQANRHEHGHKNKLNLFKENIRNLQNISTGMLHTFRELYILLIIYLTTVKICYQFFHPSSEVNAVLLFLFDKWVVEL